jgi:hypothetical protein
VNAAPRRNEDLNFRPVRRTVFSRRCNHVESCLGRMASVPIRVWRVDRPSRARFLHRQHIFGLIALTTGIAVKHGSRRLRRACIIASIFALVMPPLVGFLR